MQMRLMRAAEPPPLRYSDERRPRVYAAAAGRTDSEPATIKGHQKWTGRWLCLF